MTKFIRKEKEVVDAYQFTGGHKDGTALATLISQNGGVSAAWLPPSPKHAEERIHIVGDGFTDQINVGDWYLIKDDNTASSMSEKDFKATYEKVKFPRVKLIWKDIPGFPNWQVSNNGRVRNVGYSGYKKRTKDGDFILRRNGKEERWHESQLGLETDEQVQAFFNN